MTTTVVVPPMAAVPFSGPMRTACAEIGTGGSVGDGIAARTMDSGPLIPAFPITPQRHALRPERLRATAYPSPTPSPV